MSAALQIEAIGKEGKMTVVTSPGNKAILPETFALSSENGGNHKKGFS